MSIQTAWAEPATSTPIEVVQKWIRAYPHELERAVMLTTPAMREGLTPDQWIAAQKKLLASDNFHDMNRDIVSVRNDGYWIAVTLHTSLSSSNGDREQREHITIKPFCSVWLIDDIEVIPIRQFTKDEESKE